MERMTDNARASGKSREGIRMHTARRREAPTLMLKTICRLIWIIPCWLVSSAAMASDSLELTVFDCGSLTFADISAFSVANDETPVRELFVPCYLIRHPDGLLLWDAGLPINIVGQGDVSPQEGLTMRYDQSITDQLGLIDVDVSDIDLVAFSHMHWDHVGAANLFSESALLIQQTEYQAAFVDQGNPIFQPDLYMGLADSNMQILEGDHDVFDDGTVQIISAPGHTPGHQVLLLKLEESGALVLSGDLYHFRKSRELRRVPTFNTNAEDSLASMDKVEALLERENATLWIEHDKALADTLRKAPASYR